MLILHILSKNEIIFLCFFDNRNKIYLHFMIISSLLLVINQIQPHMMGITTARVPLPLDISEDEPIYVNAKQYHGILRRRQSRAKMEAQNKLVKIRKVLPSCIVFGATFFLLVYNLEYARLNITIE